MISEEKNNMIVLKFALRNLVRFPWRTLLYGLTVFFIVLAIASSLFVLGACRSAQAVLAEDYVFVASLVKRNAEQNIPLIKVFQCLGYENIRAFNVTVSLGEGVLPSGEALTRLPEIRDDGESPSVWIDEFCCKLYGVENLALTYPFFSGECTISSGSALTEKGYNGTAYEIVIHWWLAEKYGIRVGDTVNRRYFRQTGEISHIYIPTTVVGIYTSSEKSPNIEDYPAYIALAASETDYGKVYHSSVSLKEIVTERADFVLRGREDFADFITFAKENGLDFTSANLVFNNSTYDVLTAELKNITVIARIVFAVVLSVGACVCAFFTAYLCKSREKEISLLRALGMKRAGIYGMIAAELAVVIVLFSVGGFFVGKGAANGICSFINETVLSRASASEEIQNLNSVSEFEVTMPLEKNVRMEISMKDAHISGTDIGFNELEHVSEKEIGISYHDFYLYMTQTEALQATPEEMKAFEERERMPMRIVGITELSLFHITKMREYPAGTVAVYVSEDSPWASEESLFLTADDLGDYISVSLYEAKIAPDGGRLGQTVRYYIAGTYRDNEYCSGNDLLVSMEHYHMVYSDISVTDREHHFERIGEVFQKEEF